MTQPPTHRLAQSHIIQYSLSSTDVCLSHPSTLICCGYSHTYTTKSSILTMPLVELTLCASKTQSPDTTCSCRFAPQRQEIQADLHRPEQHKSSNWRDLQQNTQPLNQHQVQKTQVSFLTSPRHYNTHTHTVHCLLPSDPRIPPRASLPEHPLEQIPPQADWSNNAWQVNQESGALTKIRRSQHREDPRGYEKATAALLKRDPAYNRVPKAQKREPQHITTKTKPYTKPFKTIHTYSKPTKSRMSTTKTTNTEWFTTIHTNSKPTQRGTCAIQTTTKTKLLKPIHTHSKSTRSGVRNLQKIRSRLCNPKRRVTTPPPTKIFDTSHPNRKNRRATAATQQHKRKPQLSSKHQCLQPLSLSLALHNLRAPASTYLPHYRPLQRPSAPCWPTRTCVCWLEWTGDCWSLGAVGEANEGADSSSCHPGVKRHRSSKTERDGPATNINTTRGAGSLQSIHTAVNNRHPGAGAYQHTRPDNIDSLNKHRPSADDNVHAGASNNNNLGNSRRRKQQSRTNQQDKSGVPGVVDYGHQTTHNINNNRRPKLQSTEAQPDNPWTKAVSTCRSPLAPYNTELREGKRLCRQYQFYRHRISQGGNKSRPGADNTTKRHRIQLPSSACQQGRSARQTTTLYIRGVVVELDPPRQNARQTSPNGPPGAPVPSDHTNLAAGPQQRQQSPQGQEDKVTLTSGNLKPNLLHQPTQTLSITVNTEFHTDWDSETLLLHSTTQAQHSANTKQSSKHPLILYLFKSISNFISHKTFYTLSNQSNPCYAWGIYASRRAYAFISKDFALHTNHFLQTICKHYLSNSQNTLHKKHQFYFTIVYLILYCLQFSPNTMTGATKPHTRHHNSNNTTEIVMEEVMPPSKRTSPNIPKVSHKKSKSHGTSISLYRDTSQMEFWYGYPVMETIAYEAGIPPFSITIPIDELIASGYVSSEAAELRSASMSFPRVQQKLWPTTRPDGIEGQHINITQLPFDIEVNPNPTSHWTITSCYILKNPLPHSVKTKL